VTHQLETYGLVLLFVFVAVECCGVPLPGETSLITAAVLAADGHFNIVVVIAVAATGAIVGDNIGYWIARVGGRALLARVPVVRDVLPRLLPAAERFFDRHGPKAIVIARFFSGLRITAAWLAGISRMHWVQFLIYNALGGILWATVVGLAAYEFGKAAVASVTRYGLYAAGVIVLCLVAAYVLHRKVHRRRKKERVSEGAIPRNNQDVE